ncbi:hypothetical protein BJX62DRAFT_232840 [Aspergillus germanicus]
MALRRQKGFYRLSLFWIAIAWHSQESSDYSPVSVEGLKAEVDAQSQGYSSLSEEHCGSDQCDTQVVEELIDEFLDELLVEDEHSQPEFLTSKIWLDYKARAEFGNSYHCPILDDFDDSFDYNLVPLHCRASEATVKSLCIFPATQRKKSGRQALSESPR